MKFTSVKLAVLATLGIAPSLTMALGLEPLPATATAVAAGTYQPAGNTAYKRCNTTGNFGSAVTGAEAPTTTANNTCAIVPAPANTLFSPVSGFTLVAAANRTITINNANTNNTNVNVGTLVDAVFRNSAGTSCIYATQVSLTANRDANLLVGGVQQFEVNDIARGGFANSGTVNVGYAKVGANADVVYRIGRTFTSVQHRAVPLGALPSLPANGYVALPLTATGASSASINGVNAVALSVPTAAQQTALLNTNWVNFKTNASAAYPDGGSMPDSPVLYVQAACTTAAPVAVANAIRLRQTWQRQGSTGYEFIEVRIPGFVPPGGNANPVPVAGSKF